MSIENVDNARSGLPDIRPATISDLREALSRGFSDFRSAPLHGLVIGGTYTFGGLLILFVVNHLGYAFLGFPIMAGFALIGPFAAIAIYEISRLRERGEAVTWQAMARGLTPEVKRECAYLGILLIFLLAIWLKSGAVVYAMFFGMKLMSLSALWDQLFTTASGAGFLLLGHAIGAGFAVFVFSLSVVSFPLMVDRKVDFVTALITSIRTVQASPVIMLCWGAFLGLMILIGFATFFIGLALVLPVLGHASWHLYRRLVV
ncbi:MAG: DUF2189 domain-containing protein [Proteobacteria bacterium]|nr:DUF2189 domain-containing protein [Pseudomonadota bacterium]